MNNTITKIREFKEGAKVYKCSCGHNTVIPKDSQKVKCLYCGAIKEKVNYYVIS